MARVTSKLQVTIPKAIADAYGIRPGADIDWVPAGDAIRVVAATTATPAAERRRRVTLFDEATARQAARELAEPRESVATGRGWTREDLYGRGGSD